MSEGQKVVASGIPDVQFRLNFGKKLLLMWNKDYTQTTGFLDRYTGLVTSI